MAGCAERTAGEPNGNQVHIGKGGGVRVEMNTLNTTATGLISSVAMLLIYYLSLKNLFNINF